MDIFKPYNVDKNELEISFKGSNGYGGRFFGDVIFECKDAKLTFKNMFFVTSID